jgi:hypothetical protein
MFEKLKYWWINRSVQKSKEPTLRIVSEGIDANGGVKLELVWNQLFIQHIKSHGFIGETDEQCVQFYIASLVHSRQIEESQPLDHIRNG